MSEQPVLRTARLVLRPFREADASRVEELAGDRLVAETTLNIPHPYPAGSAGPWIATHAPLWADRSRVTFAIDAPGVAEMIGAITLNIAAVHARAELGYWVGVPFWNRGYCTEAARAIIGFGFSELGLHRVQARHLTRNPASGRVMQKAGMTFEGIHRGSMRKWDRFEDLAMYAILATDARPAE